MKPLWIVVIVEIALVVLAVVFWSLSVTLTEKSKVIPTKWWSACDPVQFWHFIESINKSSFYRVQNENSPNGIVYQNAVVSLVKNFELEKYSAYIVFSCPTPSGTTCDVFSLWEDSLGELRSLRNDLIVRPNRWKEFYLHVDETGKQFSLCDPHRKFISGFELVPIEETDINADQGGTVCSADKHFKDNSCSQQFLMNELVAFNDGTPLGRITTSFSHGAFGRTPQKVSSISKKRLLIVLPIALVAILGILLTAKQIAKWINNVPQDSN